MLFLIISNPLTHHHDITTEIIAFLTSLFIAVGIMKITPLINAIVHSSKMAQREKDELKTYLDLAGVIFVVIDPNQKVMMINKKGCDILGYDDKNSIIGRNWFDNFIPERLRNNVKDTFNKLILGKVEQIEYYENPILTSLGKEKVISWHNTLLEDEKGNFIGTLSAGEDITERIRIEELAKKSEEKFKMLADESPNMIFINCKGKILYTNNKCKEIMGYSTEEFSSSDFDFFKLIAPESLPRAKEHYSKHLSGKELSPYDYSLITKDGRKLNVIITTKLIDYENEKAILGIVTDITKRKQLETELLESEEKYKSLVNSIPEMIFETDKQGNIKFANSSGLNIFGYTSDDIENGLNIFSLLNKPNKKIAKMNFNKLIDGKITELTYEYSAVKKNGAIIPIIVYSHIIYNNSNEINGIGGIAIDITEQKKLEYIKKDFITSFSHEARNPLSTIKEGISLIYDEISEDITNEQKNILSIAKNNIDRLFKLINNFLDFSLLENKTLNLNPSQFDIQITLKETLNDFKNKIKSKNINIQISSEEPYFVFADPYRVHEIFANLLSNAIKFSKEKGTILLDISDIDEFIQISIKDEGIGIKTKDIKNIFKKFHKTNIPCDIKPEGIGLGLTITKQLIELMGGEIWAESEHGKGSIFIFTLPKTGE